MSKKIHLQLVLKSGASFTVDDTYYKATHEGTCLTHLEWTTPGTDTCPGRSNLVWVDVTEVVAIVELKS